MNDFIVHRLCPSCSNILEVVIYKVSGVDTKFLECPEGDWLEVYKADSENAALKEQ